MKAVLAFATLCLAMLLTACGGGYEGTASTIDSSTQPLKVVGATAITLVPTELKKVEITGGTRPYTATSGNAKVALAYISDSMLSVAGVTGDNSPITVTVTDAKNATTTVSVTVTNSAQQGTFTLSARDVALQPGATKTLTITGGVGPFTVASMAQNVMTASVSGTTITVTGVTEGVNAELKVFDSRNVTQSAFVTVAAPIPSASGQALSWNVPANLALRPSNSKTYTLGGGTPPYTVTSSNTAVIAASVRGAALMLQPGIAGNATITVMDNAGATLTQRIYVMTTSAPLSLSTSAVSAQVNTAVSVTIAGGMPPYTATTTSTSLIGSALVVNGDVLTITTQFVGGPGTVTVRDSEGSTASLQLTATAALSYMTVSPTEITISELLSGGAQTSIPVRIIAGKAPYQVFTSYPTLLIPTIVGDTVYIRTPGTSSSPIAPCVDLNTEAVITIIDATGAVATTTVTIQDNGTCP